MKVPRKDSKLRTLFRYQDRHPESVQFFKFLVKKDKSDIFIKVPMNGKEIKRYLEQNGIFK